MALLVDTGLEAAFVQDGYHQTIQRPKVLHDVSDLRTTVVSGHSKHWGRP